MAEEDPLDDLIQEAEERSQEISENQKRQQQVKDQLRERIRGFWENDEIAEDHAERLLNLVDRGQYGRVRSELQEVRDDAGLEFDEEEKADFADAFGDALESLDTAVESIRNDIQGLTHGVDRDDMIALLYGKHSGMRKGDIKDVFSAIDEVESTNLSRKDKARLLQAFESDLNIKPTMKILKAIEEER